ncbi:MAG: type VI secretion system ATPase TssH [Planctomycetes bacterium]|nr:type VI secretion system ATPase TssH [Planctomycetota bacterium]
MVDVNLKSLVGRLNRFCTRWLESAAGIAVSRTNYEVTVEHMLRAMAEDPAADIQFILRQYGIDPGKFMKALDEVLDGSRTGNAGRPGFSPMLVDWIEQAWLHASIDYKLSEIRSGTLLIALLVKPEKFSGSLAGDDYMDLLKPIKRDELRTRLLDTVNKSIEGAEAAGAKGEGGKGGAQVGGDGSALAKYCTNFTQKARENAIDPVFGRESEIRQMVDILARRRKNNPICVGEPGVGKTAVVEGLALKVVEGDVPDTLKNVEIMGLDIGLLQAGASVKGEFENRLKQVIQEIKSSPKPVILFIDEAHTLIGAGGAAGTGDAGQLLKPALARGELRTIAATTWSEYKKYFEKDAALARRFQLVKLDEPNDEVATTMLRGLRDRYEQAHGVIIRDDALVAAAQLGSRYISGRQHPDKGIDLMDTSAARVKVALTTKPAELQDMEIRIATLERELGARARDRKSGATVDEERVALVTKQVADLKSSREKLFERWQKEKAAAEKVIAARTKMLGDSKADGNGKPASDVKGDKAAKTGKTEVKAKGKTEVKGKDDAAFVGGDAKARAEFERALSELREIQGKEPLIQVEVTPEVIARVISDWTGVPIGKMVQDEASALLSFESTIGKRIKGQDHALQIVGKGVRAAKSGLKNPRTPMDVFLFVGPSGVGKTETALGVADLLFGGERYMTTINMSEFQEKHTVSRLIGSPPGYVGYGEGGMLTEAVRQRPYSVVLLDEVEKADPEVLNLFYQVFDKGTLNDGEGREVDFKDTVIFLTSNLATDLITQAGSGGQKPALDDLIGLIRPALSKHFKPALLARMTIVPFYPIDQDAMKDITRLKLGLLQNRLKESHKMTLSFDDKVVEAIAARCTEVETGARNVDHILAGTLLPKISTELLEQMSKGPLPEKLTVGLDGSGDFSFTFGKK